MVLIRSVLILACILPIFAPSSSRPSPTPAIDQRRAHAVQHPGSRLPMACSRRRRCCMESVKGEVWPSWAGSIGFLEGTDGIRATGLKHAIENRNADGGFGLLTGKGPCPKLGANNPFVSTHRGLHERAAAIAGRLLPLQSHFGLDHVDMAISL